MSDRDYVARATAKYIRISPHKCRGVADLIRGKSVSEAFAILSYSPKKAAGLISKVLQSAVSNAEQDPSVDVDKLYVKNIFIDDGPTWKRWDTRARGRATRILKRTSHITVVLDQRI
ncbi:MAG TPA: 50S ribosomal protein L22 [Proteobacteria bacterium]|nr:50S ribosomal protein L22 [Pseudomonadota bacterium]